MTRFLIALCLAALTLPGFALPTLDAVQAEIGRGHYSQAEDMMREVIAAKPGSARAHYVYAEILAHDKHFDKATEEAAQARRIDPDLQFTQPERFNAFVRLLEREQGTARRVASVSALGAPVQAQPARIQAQPAGGVPVWLWGLCAAVLALLAWRALSARGQGPAAYAAAPGAPMMPATQGYAPAAAPGGSSLLGTGLAAAGGVAAGMLVEKLLEGHREPALGLNVMPDPGPFATGFIDPESPPETAARELEQRPIDFGSGDGWGGAGTEGGSTGSDGDGW